MYKHLIKITVVLVLIFVLSLLRISESSGIETDQPSVFNIESEVEMSMRANHFRPARANPKGPHAACKQRRNQQEDQQLRRTSPAVATLPKQGE